MFEQCVEHSLDGVLTQADDRSLHRYREVAQPALLPRMFRPERHAFGDHARHVAACWRALDE
ncbi:hypothetical protein Lesp01_88860 [Lentzea sp. NBRC 102530]|nr:hypothetical protein Lesp01_88860 [Lentzea sp. NBRC 102530]